MLVSTYVHHIRIKLPAVKYSRASRGCKYNTYLIFIVSLIVNQPYIIIYVHYIVLVYTPHNQFLSVLNIYIHKQHTHTISIHKQHIYTQHIHTKPHYTHKNKRKLK